MKRGIVKLLQKGCSLRYSFSVFRKKIIELSCSVRNLWAIKIHLEKNRLLHYSMSAPIVVTHCWAKMEPRGTAVMK
jgi:hypothetical protein